MSASLQLIWAQDLNNGIGYDNKLLFNVPEDLKFFSQSTRHSTIIMGRKTWDSLPKKPLPSRRNIVLSRSTQVIEGAEVFSSLTNAINAVEGLAWVIGGESLYNEALPLASALYVTQIFEKTKNIDAYAPNSELIASYFDLVNSTEENISEKTGIKYRFLHYVRKEL